MDNPFTASELLNSELRQKYLNLLWQQVSMTQDMFNELYKNLLNVMLKWFNYYQHLRPIIIAI